MLTEISSVTDSKVKLAVESINLLETKLVFKIFKGKKSLQFTMSAHDIKWFNIVLSRLTDGGLK